MRTNGIGERGNGQADAVVVGSGPNGLAAALVLAGADLRVEVFEAEPTVGGGTRTAELTLPGFRHDVCSVAHPMALASPFFRAFGLADKVEMLQPEAAFAQPLDGRQAAVAWRDLDRTAATLGPDARAWRAVFAPLVARWPGLVEAALSDQRRPPADPLTALRLLLRVGEFGTPAWSARFRGEPARALLAGVAAHAIRPPCAPGPAGAGLLLAALGHAVGWPVPRGGSQAIADAMAAELVRRGGLIHTGRRIDSVSELPSTRVLLLDTSPAGLLRIAGRRLPESYARRLRAFRYGAAACKVDFALSGPVPWRDPACAATGTLHLSGTRAETVAVEREVAAGRHPERPFVLAVQPGVVDDTRAPAGRHTLYTYAHVPHGSTVDVGEAVTAQVERFAPGFRDLVLARRTTTAADLSVYNANYVGGDISAGAMSLRQTVFRPVPAWDPYATPLDGVFLCSASTPPGPGVHGMAGLHAARRTLRRVFGITGDPLRFVRGDHAPVP
ncbi:phytoene desaturase family protein [Kitasatospora camelliae]|uniref:Pyridine nucleotide-disulfide oxidoreductase domain-containing protein 2 n=1 Tax=Kitasatospora camelliae TaxID=3156397 RepID=A0AAU8K2A2_9ACTN